MPESFPIGTLVADNQVLAVGSELRTYARRVASWQICGAAARGGQGDGEAPTDMLHGFERTAEPSGAEPLKFDEGHIFWQYARIANVPSAR